ncbi:hypothetical protein V8C86DRAFT_2844957 [Haematococcus lacustris]
MPGRRQRGVVEADIDELLSASRKKPKVPASSPVNDGGEARTGEARAAVHMLLFSALTPSSTETNPELSELARAVEVQLLEHQGGGVATKEYKAAARNLVAALKRNNLLRERVMHGELSASQLVRLDPRALATTSALEARSQAEGKLLRKAILHDSHGVTTDEYSCPECQSTACSFVDASRRDIGKSDTWGAKQNEGRGRAVTCLTCGFRWEAGM